MDTEVYAKAADIQKTLTLFKKTIDAINEHFDTRAQMDIEDDDDYQPDKVALSIREGLLIKSGELKREFDAL